MEGFIVNIEQMETTMATYGRDMVIAFAVIVFGLILIKWINQGLKKAFSMLSFSPGRGATVLNVLCDQSI